MAEMTDFDIKRGCYKNVEGDGLENIMREVFGNVKKEGDLFVSSYGLMEKIEVKVPSKTVLQMRTQNRADVSGASEEEVLDSKRKLNDFLLKTTGFTPKDRLKRAKDKAKKGLLRFLSNRFLRGEASSGVEASAFGRRPPLLF